MKNDLTMLIAQSTTIIATLLSIIFTFGVVWRVEKKLDISFKLLLLAIISFFLSEITSLLSHWDAGVFELLTVIFKVIFALFFLGGILEMRLLLKKLDGEEKDAKE